VAILTELFYFLGGTLAALCGALLGVVVAYATGKAQARHLLKEARRELARARELHARVRPEVFSEREERSGLRDSESGA
jgi:hypothetical protein